VVLQSELTRAELAALYRAVDAFVLPSRGEGWGLPAMEGAPPRARGGRRPRAASRPLQWCCA
jgi:glycosyltransferase involved in cell wall biosynthesis